MRSDGPLSGLDWMSVLVERHLLDLLCELVAGLGLRRDVSVLLRVAVNDDLEAAVLLDLDGHVLEVGDNVRRAAVVDLLDRVRRAHGNDLGAGGDTSLDTARAVLDDEAVLRVVAELLGSQDERCRRTRGEMSALYS